VLIDEERWDRLEREAEQPRAALQVALDARAVGAAELKPLRAESGDLRARQTD
jgi:hypothetical protein